MLLICVLSFVRYIFSTGDQMTSFVIAPEDILHAQCQPIRMNLVLGR